MKKLAQLIIISLAFTLLVVSQAVAYPISSEQEVYLLQSTSGAVNGDFGVYDAQLDNKLFNTFCVEENVFFTPGVTYTATVDATIIKENGSTQALDNGTKYLYWNFYQGTLTGFSGTRDDVSALQNAIWRLQGYSVDVTGNEFYTLASAQANQDAGSSLDVMVLNLWNGSSAAQSQLIAGSAPVPEPATMVLLGSGLVGLAFYRRMKRR